MKAKLLRKVRKGCSIEQRGNEYRFCSKRDNYSWANKFWALAYYRSHVLYLARNSYKPKKKTIIKF